MICMYICSDFLFCIFGDQGDLIVPWSVILMVDRNKNVILRVKEMNPEVMDIHVGCVWHFNNIHVVVEKRVKMPVEYLLYKYLR